MKKTIVVGIALVLVSSWFAIRIFQPNPEFFELPAFTKERDQVVLRIYCFRESPDFDRHFENVANVQASLLASLRVKCPLAASAFGATSTGRVVFWSNIDHKPAAENRNLDVISARFNAGVLDED